MHEELLNALRFRRPQIRQRWTDLIHADPAPTPLGQPAALIHLLDWSLDEIDRALMRPSVRRRIDLPHQLPAACGFRCCGQNPLKGYFVAGQQAMQEALILAQAAMPELDPIERDASLEELTIVVQAIARREIDAFCGVCQLRERSEGGDGFGRPGLDATGDRGSSSPHAQRRVQGAGLSSGLPVQRTSAMGKAV